MRNVQIIYNYYGTIDYKKYIINRYWLQFCNNVTTDFLINDYNLKFDMTTVFLIKVLLYQAALMQALLLLQMSLAVDASVC